ncbi:NYN domain-containing protein [Candidatus Haliotispira prima]|uniref:NYN domain-containing protein n=1 Tax=Candidatus Haliotispira prima TaxID=3034016 RepID=A0ABY8MHH7_9SPIO|nr:NYN domain-containing protein [Candidatus Haliotispira prima]
MESNAAFELRQKVAVYIDGFNLYYGIKSLNKARLKWLDVYLLAQNFMKPNMHLTSVNYFTSRIKGTKKEAILRQQVYLAALKVHSPELFIEYGKFLSKDIKCPHCDCYSERFEEKRTDVNIACRMLSDIYKNKMDTIILVSGDSDFYMPVKIARELNKHVIVAMPPKRKSKDLENTANNCFSINETMLRKALLPQTIQDSKGHKITQPVHWT